MSHLFFKNNNHPVYNLFIEIQNPYSSLGEDLESLIIYAQIFFAGNNHVLNDGELRRGCCSMQVPNYTANFPLGINGESLSALPDFLLGKPKYGTIAPLVLKRDAKSNLFVIVNNSRLYIHKSY